MSIVVFEHLTLSFFINVNGINVLAECTNTGVISVLANTAN